MSGSKHAATATATATATAGVAPIKLLVIAAKLQLIVIVSLVIFEIALKFNCKACNCNYQKLLTIGLQFFVTVLYMFLRQTL